MTQVLVNRLEGYGQLRVAGRLEYTHRLAYQLFVGPIPDGLGDLKETCANGHPWIAENIVSNGANGRRTCRICKCDRERVRRERRKAVTA